MSQADRKLIWLIALVCACIVCAATGLHGFAAFFAIVLLLS